MMEEIRLPFDLKIGDTVGGYVATIGYCADTLELAMKMLKKDNPDYYIVNSNPSNIKAFGLTIVNKSNTIA